jgi:hypothetical protein
VKTNLSDTFFEYIHQIDTAFKNAKMFNPDTTKSKIPIPTLPRIKFIIERIFNPIAKIRFK